MNSPMFDVAILFFAAFAVGFLYLLAASVQNPFFWGMVFSFTVPVSLFIGYLYKNGHV